MKFGALCFRKSPSPRRPKPPPTSGSVSMCEVTSPFLLAGARVSSLFVVADHNITYLLGASLMARITKLELEQANSRLVSENQALRTRISELSKEIEVLKQNAPRTHTPPLDTKRVSTPTSQFHRDVAARAARMALAREAAIRTGYTQLA